MSNPIVEQLAHGLKVFCPLDGETVVCKPLSVGLAMEIEAIDVQLQHAWAEVKALETVPPDEPADAAAARLAAIDALRLTLGKRRRDIADTFLAAYPELRPHISYGDVDGLLPSFFWPTTGAAVVRADPSPPTGTDSGVSTPPPISPSPT